MLLKLFFMFVKLFAFAFGGGYIMIPSLITASKATQWVTTSELSNVIALSGISPGPVAVNVAIGYGYKAGGFPGAFVSFLGIVIPCAVIVIFVASLFFKAYEHPKVQAAFYGLRPVITAITLYAAYSVAKANNIIFATSEKLIQKGWYFLNLFELKSILIALLTFLILAKTKTPPIFIILAAGCLGIFIF